MQDATGKGFKEGRAQGQDSLEANLTQGKPNRVCHFEMENISFLWGQRGSLGRKQPARSIRSKKGKEPKGGNA